jgi:hypothetical protein
MARSLTVQHEENLKPSGLFLFFLGAAAVVLALSGYAADEPALAAEPPAPTAAPAPL